MEGADARHGLGFAALAYGIWGVAPLFWRLLNDVPPAEILAHRTVWASVVMAALLWITGRRGEVAAVLRDPARRRWLWLSAALLGANWFVFLYAVSTGRVLHASLGYYLNPIVSVALGMVFLGERLRPLQWLAVGFALTGVGVLLLRAGELPWIGLALALCFGLYGLLRKRVDVKPLPGSLVEVSALAIPGALAIGALALSPGGGHFGAAPHTTALLGVTGLFTALPLLFFTAAARRLSLFSLGFMQYIAPTAQLVVAVGVLGEPFARAHAAAFGLIWVGVGLFAADLLRHRRAAYYATARLTGADLKDNRKPAYPPGRG